jgi:polyisoprenoid-binding protein YceI
MPVVDVFQPTSGKFVNYQIDNSSSSINFQIMKFKIGAKVPGQFKKFSGSFNYNKVGKAISEFRISIESDSIDTANQKRDDHLKSSDFFATSMHKTIDFNSQGPYQIIDNRVRIVGNLTIKQTTKPIVFDIILDDQANILSLNAVGLMMDRKDWGVTWNAALDKGGFVLSDEVEIKISIKAIKK